MKRTILLTDVEAEIHRQLRTKLLTQNYEVICASNLQEALDHFDLTLIDLLLTDLDVPMSDRERILRRMTRLNPALRVIGLTERSDMHEGGTDFGLSVVAEKPLDVRHLLSVIEVILSEGPGLIEFCCVPPRAAKPRRTMFYKAAIPGPNRRAQQMRNY